MAKMTKAQAKRMTRDVRSKCSKLFLIGGWGAGPPMSVKDVEAITKIMKKVEKRIG